MSRADQIVEFRKIVRDPNRIVREGGELDFDETRSYLLTLCFPPLGSPVWWHMRLSAEPGHLTFQAYVDPLVLKAGSTNVIVIKRFLHAAVKELMDRHIIPPVSFRALVKTKKKQILGTLVWGAQPEEDPVVHTHDCPFCPPLEEE